MALPLLTFQHGDQQSDVWSTSNNTATVESVPLTIAARVAVPCGALAFRAVAHWSVALAGQQRLHRVHLALLCSGSMADVGVQGGGPGSDGAGADNCFIAFIGYCSTAARE